MKQLVKKKIRRNRVGHKFGKLTILSYAGHDGKEKYWDCLCDCGNKLIRDRLLIASITKTCGKCPKPQGSKHYAWQGCGELSHNLYTVYKHGAIARGLEFSVTIEYLWDLFLKQDGKCALTGWKLYFNKTYRTQTNKTASLDRINSSQGYIEDNLQWVHKDVNKLKKNMGNDRFIDLCKAVALKSI